MQLGVVFPQTEIGPDPSAVREYAQAVEEMGYQHLAVYDHVLGADPANRPGWQGPYTHRSLFHEPMVLFGYLAELTRRIELCTSIVILPQRQTVLAAKQAAEVDLLTGGRLRFGVGIGWNEVEYEALGENFHTRGRRVEEQIEVLRLLWTQDVVNFHGRWHHISDAGINPLPVQRPIPIWMGGRADPAMRRIARIASGWFPQFRPDERGQEIIRRFQGYVAEAGRQPADVGIEARISVSSGGPEDWARDHRAWQELGATHIAVNTMGAGFTSLDQHLQALRRFRETVVG